MSHRGKKLKPKKKASEAAALAARQAAIAYLQENDAGCNDVDATKTLSSQRPEHVTGFSDALTALRKRRRREAKEASGAAPGGNAPAAPPAEALASQIGSLLSKIKATATSLRRQAAEEEMKANAVALAMAAGAAPEGWERIKDPDSGDTYWWNTASGVVTWVKPGTHQDGSLPQEQRDWLVRNGLLRTGVDTLDLPKGWELAVVPDTGEVYHWNTHDDTTSWEKPGVHTLHDEDDDEEDHGSRARGGGGDGGPSGAGDSGAGGGAGAGGSGKRSIGFAKPTRMLKPPGKTNVKFALKRPGRVLGGTGLFKKARR